MMLNDRTFFLIAVVVIISGLAAVTFLARPSHGQTPSAAQDTASLAYFSRAATVLLHPRCMNCHTAADFPRQGDDGHPHIMQVKRGVSNAGTPALPCSTCHQASNSASGVPGNEVWHLAPLRMAWEGLTVGEICRSLTDPAKGGMTHQRLVEHLATDHLVAWAWEPGSDLTGKPRSTPPMTHAEFSGLIKQWVESGAACPS